MVAAPGDPRPLAEALAGAYRLERELEQGGMATVYLAEDLEHHRRVALKVLRPELAGALDPDRFAREIEIAARLQHPLSPARLRIDPDFARLRSHPRFQRLIGSP